MLLVPWLFHKSTQNLHSEPCLFRKLELAKISAAKAKTTRERRAATATCPMPSRQRTFLCEAEPQAANVDRTTARVVTTVSADPWRGLPFAFNGLQSTVTTRFCVEGWALCSTWGRLDPFLRRQGVFPGWCWLSPRFALWALVWALFFFETDLNYGPLFRGRFVYMYICMYIMVGPAHTGGP